MVVTATPDWTSLPEHLLASIAKRLHNRIDLLRFRAVCRLFRCIIPPVPKVLFPFSILTSTDFLRGPNPLGNDLFYPTESTVYAIKPFDDETSQTWLIKVDETKPGRVQIKDPLSGYPYNNLSWKLPKSMNLLDYRVKEISKSYRLVSTGFFVAKYPYKVYPKSFSVSAKMIFTSHLDETDDEFAVMAKFGTKNLSMWRNFDKKWTNVEMYLESSEYILDIIYHTHKFYVLISRGVTMSLDSKSMTIDEVPSPPEDSNSQLISLLRLVESCKDLLLIGKYRDSGENKDHYKVFKLNEERCEWLPELELEDRALVMDRDGSYSLSAKEFSGCRGNSIYFLDDYSSPKYGHPGEGVRIFDLQDGSVGELSKFPGNSHLFWPPPTWLK